MRGIKVKNQAGLKLLKDNAGRRKRRTPAFSAFGKRTLFQARIQQLRTGQADGEYDESDFAHEAVSGAETKATAAIPRVTKKAASTFKRLGKTEAAGKMPSAKGTGRMEAAKRAADGARPAFQKNAYVRNAVLASGAQAKGLAALKQKKVRQITLRNRTAMMKACILGMAFLVVFTCLFSGAAGGAASSIDMGRGQDNITSAYLYLGTLEAKNGKLTGRGVTIDAEPIMAYMIAEYGIVQTFDEGQRQQLTKIYNAINAQGCRSNAGQFFNAFHASAFSSSAKYDVYKKLMAEGIYNDFKTLGSPFIGRDWASRISSSWGWRIHPKSGNLKLHRGLDIAMPAGTPINAVCSGTVASAGWRGGYGNCVIVQHMNGDTQLSVLYAHMSSINVRAGMKIGEGDVVGKVGTTGYSTGNHLHVEVMAGSYSPDAGKLFYPRIYMREKGDGKSE